MNVRKSTPSQNPYVYGSSCRYAVERNMDNVRFEMQQEEILNSTNDGAFYDHHMIIGRGWFLRVSNREYQCEPQST